MQYKNSKTLNNLVSDVPDKLTDSNGPEKQGWMDFEQVAFLKNQIYFYFYLFFQINLKQWFHFYIRVKI